MHAVCLASCRPSRPPTARPPSGEISARNQAVMSIQLPAPIEHYIQIENSGALEAVPKCFAPDAVVRDEGQTFEGVAAIRNWMAATKKKYGHTVAPLEFAERGGQSVLKAKLAGSFPGSPITVSFGFVLAGR